MNYLGIEIGGTKLQLVLADANAKIHVRRKFIVDKESGAAGIRERIQRALPELAAAGRISATGVGFGGPVDWKTGRIRRSHQVEGWSEFDLAGWLKELNGGTPVSVDNDANVAALAEAVDGAGANSNPVFYVTLGSGVGGGLVVDREIYHGAAPGESEIGHVRLDRSGAIVESRCSGWAVDAKIRKLKHDRPDAPLARMSSEVNRGEAKYLAKALAEGDSSAAGILQETAEDLAFALSHVVHLFHPEVMVLGGGLSLVGEPLRAAVAGALPRLVMDAFAPGPAIMLARYGEDAVTVGAIRLAHNLVARA